MPRYRERRRREQMLPEGLTDSDRELHAPHHRRVAEDRGTLARIFFHSEKYHSPLGFVRPESEVKGELSAAPTKSQGPNWLRITSQVLPAAVSFLHNLSSGARLSSAMVMM